MSYKQINTDCVIEEFIAVVDVNESNPQPLKVVTATYYKSVDNHLWKVVRDANCEEIKTDLGVITP